ncbi:type IX secretion system outer membrane channel protein PorV [Flaviaesturariibacter aridisoli]|uniref:Type IX secretion system outer membrane channel protein PorV n=1 Tax=Flaviaesturariibacter aridisoli TaxID=2545761 RepID=A0A4R4EAM3_9BACT|nr:type IX secretion system outer membrane channel protein PorV [Flaviaesturariibacter aridisoli]TCZ74938.1 type IX secretion system outer membrane channel protein PorV [Flaviaesturariibacter aridisoli]
MRATALKLTVGAILLGSSTLHAQQKLNVVTTAVPFLRISPDARAGGMGELSVATNPDAAASYFNLGKVPFNEQRGGINVTYTPWLKKFVNDVYMASAAGYYKIDDNSAVSGSLRYFSLGNIQFTDENGNALSEGRPREFGVDLAYSRKLSPRTGIGVGLKYIHSNLAGNTTIGSTSYKPGNAIAGDIGLYHNRQNSLGQGWAFGLALTNLGSKIAYTNNAQQKDFIPANFAIGTTYTFVFNESNKLMVGADFNKLLVPTPPAFDEYDPNGTVTQNQVDSINSARATSYRNKSVVGSWFSSFGDAPGGFSEELREWQVSAGAEYWYNNQFALRAGYFYEDKTKGNRRYFTAGVGLKYSSFGLNFSYLVPSGGNSVNQNPLSNTLRFSLMFDLGGNNGSATSTTAQ